MNTNNLNMIGNFGANSVQNYSLGQSDQSAKQEAVEEKLIDFSFTSNQKEMVSEELNASTDYLGEIDEDGDGKVTDNELLGFLKSLFNKNKDEDLTGKLDSNGDGIITQEEVDAYNETNNGADEIAGEEVPAAPEEAETAEEEKDYLPELDTDGDGKVTEDEILSFIESKLNSDVPEEELVDISGEIDSNGDGIITQEELDSYNYRTQDITDKLDANGDGIITQEEIDEFNKANEAPEENFKDDNPEYITLPWSGHGEFTIGNDNPHIQYLKEEVNSEEVVEEL